MDDLEQTLLSIRRMRAKVPASRAVLVGLSGIDASGKGYLAERITTGLRAQGLRVACIGVDGWLNLPSVRFSQTHPDEHFYTCALRLEELFARLILPLRDTRSVNLKADFTEETASAYRPHTYRFEDVDVIVLEGIFLFKPAYRHHHDLRLWVECSFETALERALARTQEGLTPEATIRAYETIYFPAQRIHLERDQPRQAAHAILYNDSRLVDSAGRSH